MAQEVDLRSAHAIFHLVDEGKLGLPDFQRGFEWSTADVRAFLSTVLAGLPSGTLMIASNEHLDLNLHALQGAPDLHTVRSDQLVLLDGQQRVTSLYQALAGSGSEQYYVDFDALVDGADLLQDEVIGSVRVKAWSKLVRENPKRALVPIQVLRSTAHFFGWLNSPEQARLASIVDAVGMVFSNVIVPIDNYMFVVMQMGGELSLATVAQAFERTNKWGQPLDTFDLMVARLQGRGWGLRQAWEHALSEAPSIARVVGENGFPVVSALSLYLRNDVRRSAVLSLRSADVESNWSRAIKATEDVCGMLFEEGVQTPDLVPYESVLAALVSARMRDVPLDILRRYFWLASSTRWHEVASNTRAIADVRLLANGDINPEIDRRPLDAEDIELCTRRSNRSLWAALCALMVSAGPLDLATGERLSDANPEGAVRWQIVPFIKGGGQRESVAGVPLRLRAVAHLFVLRDGSARFRRQGFTSVVQAAYEQPLIFGPTIDERLLSQFLPKAQSLLGVSSLEEVLRGRAEALQRLLSQRTAPEP